MNDTSPTIRLTLNDSTHWIRGAVFEYAVVAVVMKDNEPRSVVVHDEAPDGWAIFRRPSSTPPGAEQEVPCMLESHGLFPDASQALLNATELALEEFQSQEKADSSDLAEHPEDDAVRQAAKDQYHSDGEIEVHTGAPVSRGDEPGAYVQAWVWVYFDDVPGLSAGDVNDDAA